jgi:hypothetical protein
MKKLFLLKLALATFCIMQAPSLKAQWTNIVEPAFLINSPASIAGVKTYTRSHDGTTSTSNWGRAIDSFWYNLPVVKPQGADSIGCNTLPAGSMTGKFALIRRGTCNFSEKAYNAQQAGAAVCIIANNVSGGPVGMAAGINAALVTIPVIMISMEDGDAISALLNNGVPVNASLTNWGFGFTHDLGIVPNSLPLFHDMAIPKYELATTSPQAYKYYLGGFIANVGTSTETNVQLKQVITFTPTGSSTPTILKQDSITTGSFTTLDSVKEMFATAGFSLPPVNSTGTLTFTNTVTSSTPDNQPGNNTLSYDVKVTDSIYSKARINANGEPIATVGYRYNGQFTNTWGPLFYVGHGGRRAAMSQFTVSAGSTIPLLTGSVTLYIFKWADANSDKIINHGELNALGYGTKTFGTNDSNFKTYTVNFTSFTSASTPIVLDSNSWYWVAAEVTNDMFLGCDGQVNYFSRSYAQNLTTVPTVEYWAPQFQGSYNDLSSADPNDNLTLYPFSGGPTVQSIDSVSFIGAKGLVPAITLHTAKIIVGVNDVKGTNPDVTMYPNPTSNILNVKVATKGGSSPVYLTVIDGIGKVVGKFEGTTGNIITIDTKRYQSGNYFLMVRTSDGMMSSKTFTVLNK